jgi:hypothetical protein
MPFIFSNYADPIPEYKAPKAGTRNPLAVANDTVITGVNAGLGLGKSVSDMVSVNNPISRGLQSVIDYGSERQSDLVKQNEAELAADMDGDWQQQLTGVGKYVAQNPLQTAAKVVGNLGPMGRVIKGATALGGVRAGVGAGMAIGGAGAGGDAAGDAYKQVMDSPNIPEADKERLARQAAREASVVPALIGTATGAFGLERVMAAGKTLGSKGVLKAGAKEFGQESVEEGATKASANIAAGQYDPSIDPMRGVVGSAALGGVMGAAGGAGMTHLNNRAIAADLLGTGNPSVDARQADQGPTLGLGYNPLAGTPIVFPDGTVTLGSEQELTKRYGAQPTAKDPIPNMGDEATTATATATEAAAAPSATAVFSAEEKELIDMGVRPSAKAKVLLQEIKTLGLDDDAMVPVITAMSENKFQQAKTLLAKAMIDANKAKAAAPITEVPATQPLQAAPTSKLRRAPAPGAVQGAADVSAVVPPAGGPAAGVGVGSAVVPGSLVDPGPVADVAGEVRGDAAGAAAPVAEAAVQPSDAVQPAAAVEETPAVAETPAVEADPLDTLLAEHFKEAKDPSRQSAIAKAYLTAMRLAPKGTKGQVQAAIAAQFGIKPVTVRKYGNNTELLATAKRLGMDPADLIDMGLSDNTKAAPKAKVEVVATKDADGVTQLPYLGEGANDVKNITKDNEKAKALTDVGFESSDEAETSGFGGMDDARTWMQGGQGMGDTTNAKDEAQHNRVVALLEAKEKLQESVEEFLAQGLNDAATSVTEQQAAIDAKIAAELSKLEDHLLGKSRRTSLSAPDVKTKPAKSAIAGKEDVVAARYRAKQAAAVEDGRTTWEQAQDAWNSTADAVEGLPQFEDLSQSDQDTFTEFGPENWSRQDVVKFAQDAGTQSSTDSRNDEELDSEDGWFNAADTLELTRGDLVTLKTDTGKFQGAVTSLEKLRQFPGIERSIAKYERDGSDVVGRVETWIVANDASDFDGAVMMVGGKVAVVLRSGVLVDETRAEWAMDHELGHIADNAIDDGGVFSSQPEFNVVVRNGAIIPKGAVMQEALAFYNANPDSPLAKTLAYPFDTKRHDKLDADGVRMELFAQLWATFQSRDGREALADNLPKALELLESHYESTQESESGSAAQAAAGAPQESRGQAAQANRGVTGQPGAVQGKTRFLTRDDLPVALRPVTRAIGTVLKGIGRRGMNVAMFTEDLLSKAVSKGLAAAKGMQSINQERAALMGNMERDVEQIAQMYNKVPVSEQGTGPKSVNQFIYDSTREGKWAFQPNWRADKVTVDPVLAARWKAMSNESRALAAAMFNHGDKMLKLKKQTVIDATHSEYDALIAAATKGGDTAKATSLAGDKKSQLARFETLFRINEYRPYAPMKRYGDWVVIAKSDAYLAAEAAGDTALIQKLQSSSDDYHVDFAESEASADELTRQLQEQGAFAKDGVKYRQKDVLSAAYDRGGMMDAFQKIRKALDAQAEDVAVSGLTGEDAKDAKRAAAASAKAREVVTQLYLASLAESSARKSEMKRRGVAGELDMLRSFATQGLADASFLASVRFNGQTQDVLNALRKQVRDGGDENAKSELFNEIALRHEQSVQYNPSVLTDRAARMTSVWFLATSPAYYLQNLMQPIMMSMPVMAGRHNYLKVGTALTKAYKDLAPMFTAGKPIDFDSAPIDVRAAIKTLADRGRIDIGINTEMGRFQVGSGSLAGAVVNKVDDFLSTTSQKMEAVNRISTAIAAYRMEIAKTGDAKGALEYAEQVLSQTHGDYSRLNAPRPFNTNAGKVLLQFRKFQLIQLTLLAKLTQGSITGPDQVANRKALGFLLTHTGVMAGAMGLPGYAAISWLLGALGMLGDDDEPQNAELALRRMIGDEDMADLLLKGVPAYLGVDLSRKVGMTPDKLLPAGDIDLSSRSGAEATMAAVMGGPLGGLGLRALDGINLMRNGDYYKGLEQLMPTGITSAMKAYRTADEGVTRRNGDVVLSADEVSFAESMAQALGFAPTDQADRTAKSQIKYEFDTKFQERAAKIKNDFTKARRNGESTEEARAAWTKLQDTRAKNGYTRQPLSSLMRAPVEQAKRERNTAGGIQFDKSSRRFAQELATD